MRYYEVFSNSNGVQEAVKQGWSWPAYLFHWVWAFFKNLWELGLVTLLSWTGLALTSTVLEWSSSQTKSLVPDITAGNINAALYLSYLLVPIVFGLRGNRWRSRRLLERGYTKQGIVHASNAEHALELFAKQSGS